MVGLPPQPDFTPLQGGVPIAIDESGDRRGRGQRGDERRPGQPDRGPRGGRGRAEVPAGTAPKPASQVSYFDHETVTAAFAKGEPLLQVPGYEVNSEPARRARPSRGPLWETDVVYVVEGAATLVTGGTTVDPKETEPGQIRGTSIEGGETHELAAGDVVVIPNGVPHWFKAVQAPFLLLCREAEYGQGKRVMRDDPLRGSPPLRRLLAPGRRRDRRRRPGLPRNA